MKGNNRISAPDARRNGMSAVRGLLMTALVLVSVIGLLSIMPTQVGALDPHIATGTVYEANGTICDNCTVDILNTRTGGTGNTTSNATGVYAFNLLNLLGGAGWSYGDTIQITATNATNSTGVNSTQIKVGTLSTGIDVWIGTTQAVSGVNFYIVDENGYPVQGAYINIKDNSGDIVTTKITDSDGKASADLSNGLYTVTISKSGYDDVVKVIRVHGCDYAIRIGGVEVVGITMGDVWWWVLIILAIVGTIAILGYVAKKA
jgi:hypothetical protein